MKIRLRLKDLLKILLGGRILIESNTYGKIIEVRKGRSSYITK